ncbi:MAG: Spy/CpxP family protein refolding chaperone [Gammaproteobacteria bacterium]|nr:Spy/CpxP family protein refolding chaperone [Gammaproteobacteria bacterium]
MGRFLRAGARRRGVHDRRIQCAGAAARRAPHAFCRARTRAGGPFHLMMLVDVLDLDKEQRKRVGVVMDAVMPKMREVLFSLSDSRKALEEVFEGQVSDDKQLRKLADEQGRLMAEMLYLHMKARADLRAVLTEEQLEQLEGFRAGHGARRFMKHRGRFHDSGERSRTEP